MRIAEADCVVLRPGISSRRGLEREVACLAESQCWHKVVLFVPPSDEIDEPKQADQRLRVYNLFRERCGKFFPQPLPELNRTHFVWFDESNRPMVTAPNIAWWRNSWPIGYQNTMERELIAMQTSRGKLSSARLWPWQVNLAINTVIVPVLVLFVIFLVILDLTT